MTTLANPTVKIHTHYIHSVLVQDFVSGQVEACCVTEPVTIATSCDAVNSHNRQDLIQSLVPTYYVCIKFI